MTFNPEHISKYFSVLVVLFAGSCSEDRKENENRTIPLLVGEPIIPQKTEELSLAREEVEELNVSRDTPPGFQVEDQNSSVSEEGIVVNGKILPLDQNETIFEPLQTLPPMEAGSLYKPFAFSNLMNFKYKVDWEKDGKDFDFSAYANRVPKRLRDQSGSKVAVEGFMIPTIVDENNEVKEFLLLPDQMSCCFGQPPEANGWIVVTAEEGVEVLMDRIIRVTGEIMVEERWDEEFFVGLYHMICKEVTGPAL